jgi:hypothetical protein
MWPIFARAAIVPTIEHAVHVVGGPDRTAKNDACEIKIVAGTAEELFADRDGICVVVHPCREFQGLADHLGDRYIPPIESC